MSVHHLPFRTRKEPAAEAKPASWQSTFVRCAAYSPRGRGRYVLGLEEKRLN